MTHGDPAGVMAVGDDAKVAAATMPFKAKKPPPNLPFKKTKPVSSLSALSSYRCVCNDFINPSLSPLGATAAVQSGNRAAL